jgi:hypothetical protein
MAETNVPAGSVDIVHRERGTELTASECLIWQCVSPRTSASGAAP